RRRPLRLDQALRDRGRRGRNRGPLRPRASDACARAGLRSPLPGSELQRRMAGDGEEVGVLAKQLRLVADRDRGDQAVGELAPRLRAAAAESVQLSGALVVGGTLDRKELGAEKQSPQPLAVGLVAS